MQYTFRNRPHDSLVEIEITPLHLIIREKGVIRSIPFSNISDVHLEHRSDVYYTHIHSLDFGSVHVSNRSYIDATHWQDLSRHYETFVRVLHYHLKSKCPAEFHAGWKPTRILIKTILLTLLASGSYFVEDRYDMIFLSPVLTAGLLTSLGFLVIMLPFFTQRPRSYDPADIPVNMLPPAP